MPYAYVVAGAVQTTGNPPQTWKLKDGRWCSGFDLRPDLWQAEGWLPLTENRPAIDATTQQYGPPVFTVGASAVTADYPAVARPASAIDDDAGEAFIRAQLPARVTKAKAVIADPSGSPAWTAMETKVILALVVLDLTKRMR